VGYTITPDTVVYHGNCQDGFTGAWIAWKRYGDYPEYVAGFHGKEPPDVKLFENKDVLFIDFTYPLAIMVAIGFVAKSLVVLDHHKTAEASLADFLSFDVGDEAGYDRVAELSNVRVGFDMKRSGAMLAWHFLFPNDPAPIMVNHVQDRDLWRKQLTSTDAICMWLFSFDYTWENWDMAAAAIEASDKRRYVIEAGEAIMRKHMKDIGELLPLTTRTMTLRGYRVPIANLPYTMASDGANILAKDAPFGATYWVDTEANAQFSLRSIGDFDVSAIAKTFGGGGHKNASGFRVPMVNFRELWETVDEQGA
jgi:hypothetical protein